MANPNPRKEHLRPQPWPPGVSGNPGGYSRSRRVSDALLKLIEESKADPTLARVWLAKAIGDPKLLKKPDGTILDPHLGWFAMLIDRIEGKVPAERPAETSDEQVIGFDVINDDGGKVGPA